MIDTQQATPFISLTDVAKHYQGLSQQIEALGFLQENISADVLAKFAELWRSTHTETIYIMLDDPYKITLAASTEKLKTFVIPLNQGFECFNLSLTLSI